MKRPMQRRQAGFTLVEIAIVLVIIGLLLGGVLKGQELINSAKSKAVINDFRNTATMIAAYQDRFKALPGDDKTASSHLTNLVAADDIGDNDGLIEGSWKSVLPADETARAWQHLRLANFAAGDITAPAVGDWEPKNSEGGRVGIQSSVPFAGMRGRVFSCQGNISGRIARQVDTTMDDGKPDSGSVQFGPDANVNTITGAVGGAPIAAAAVDENTLYVVCASF